MTAQLGVVPVVAEGAPAQPAQLKTYTDMALDEPLPDKANPQLVYPGCRAAHRQGSAVRAHRRGDPARQRQLPAERHAVPGVDLQVGQSETLEVVEADGSTVTYELKLVSIDKSISNASTARVRDAFRAQAKAARELARRAPKLSELRYSPWGGGFVFAGHPAFAARAHAASQHGR